MLTQFVRVLGGNREPFRDIVLMNAGAALVVGGLVATLVEGVASAADAIATGAAKQALDRLVEVSNTA